MLRTQVVKVRLWVTRKRNNHYSEVETMADRIFDFYFWGCPTFVVEQTPALLCSQAGWVPNRKLPQPRLSRSFFGFPVCQLQILGPLALRTERNQSRELCREGERELESGKCSFRWATCRLSSEESGCFASTLKGRPTSKKPESLGIPFVIFSSSRVC